MKGEPMRLIDADALKGELCNEYSHIGERIKMVTVFALVRDAPTIEAVEVVRCRDCKHCDIYKNGYNTFCNLGNLMDDIYGFCSDAERRENDTP